MTAPRNHLLTITLTPAIARVVEAKRAGQGVKILRSTTLQLGEGVGLDDPSALGQALDEHLRSNGYTTRHAVIGLCSRWVLARHKRVPPADAEAMRGMISLQVEREFAGTAAEMVFDYLAPAAVQSDGQTRVTLAGARTTIIEQAQQVATHAGLKLVGITPIASAVAEGRDGNVALVDGGVASVMCVEGGTLLGLASCPVDTANLGDSHTQTKLLGDIARALLQLPTTGRGDGLTLLLGADSEGLDHQPLADAAQERFGSAQVLVCDSAQRLAEHVLAPDTELIDFNDSRLAAAPPQRLSPAKRWLVRAAVVALLVGGTVGYLWYDAASTRNSLLADYDAIKDKAEELKGLNDDIKFYDDWYDKRPGVLDCMLELTRTFPKRGEIRVKTLVLQADMTGQIECQAADRQTMDSYFIEMQQSDALLEVNRGGVRQSPGKGTSIDFPVAFRFSPKVGGGRP